MINNLKKREKKRERKRKREQVRKERGCDGPLGLPLYGPFGYLEMISYSTMHNLTSRRWRT